MLKGSLCGSLGEFPTPQNWGQFSDLKYLNGYRQIIVEEEAIVTFGYSGVSILADLYLSSTFHVVLSLYFALCAVSLFLCLPGRPFSVPLSCGQNREKF